jgi:hypothetical protein
MEREGVKKRKKRKKRREMVKKQPHLVREWIMMRMEMV